MINSLEICHSADLLSDRHGDIVVENLSVVKHKQYAWIQEIELKLPTDTLRGTPISSARASSKKFRFEILNQGLDARKRITFTGRPGWRCFRLKSNRKSAGCAGAENSVEETKPEGSGDGERPAGFCSLCPAEADFYNPHRSRG